MTKSPITCHVLDASIGKPADGVHIILQELDASKTDTFLPLAEGVTNADGRCLDLLPPRGGGAAKEKIDPIPSKTYKICFETKEYFARTKRESFYPWVEITFTVENQEEHCHIPLLISPFSFTTYRGT